MNDDRRKMASADNKFEERRGYSAEFKAQVTKEALKGEKSHAELAMEFAIHPNLVSLWKRQMLNNLSLVFEDDNVETAISPREINECNSQIGKLMAENDFLIKVLGR